MGRHGKRILHILLEGCQQKKSITKAPAGHLQPIEVPTQVWNIYGLCQQPTCISRQHSYYGSSDRFSKAAHLEC